MESEIMSADTEEQQVTAELSKPENIEEYVAESRARGSGPASSR
jgi:hypothetical protein